MHNLILVRTRGIAQSASFVEENPRRTLGAYPQRVYLPQKRPKHGLLTQSDSSSVCLAGSPLALSVSLFVISFRDWSSSSACARSSPSTLARPGARWATPAGSSTALSMASNPMARCPLMSQSARPMTLSMPSSVKLGLESMSLEPSSLTWNPVLLVGFCIYLI